MPRPLKYRTNDEKAAANRAKSKRYYDKKKASKAGVEHPNRPGRPRKYQTAGEKQMACKQKNERYYAKNKSIIRVRQSVRHKEVQDCNAIILPLKAIHRLDKSDTPHALSPSPLGSDINNQSDDIGHWSAQAELVAVRLNERIGNTAQEYLESVYTSYSITHRKNDIRDEITVTSKLQKAIYRCQDYILQLAGLGPEWRRAEEISKVVRKVVQWLEDILVWAMVDPDTLLSMHNNQELAYQTS